MRPIAFFVIALPFFSRVAAVALPSNIEARQEDPQKSLTLDPSVIAEGFNQDGQAEPTPGQVPSRTSPNNFINFCINKPITNGKQIRSGSCNPAPMGDIPSTDKMPSSKFVTPKNLQNFRPNTAFTIKMSVNNLDTGNFVNPNTNYYAAPQQLNDQGTILGHSHVVIEKINSIDQTTPTDPNVFAFFKGLNADGDVLSTTVDKGLPAGTYRCCSINTSSNHAPVVVAVAQRGSTDDCVYMTVGRADKDRVVKVAARR